jgi:hypothetical protein
MKTIDVTFTFTVDDEIELESVHDAIKALDVESDVIAAMIASDIMVSAYSMLMTVRNATKSDWR